MRGAVLPDQACSVNAEHHGKFLQGYVVDYLVVCPLGEGGVDAAIGLHPACGQACGKSHGVLFFYAHVEKPLREFFSKAREAAAEGHRRSDCDHSRVFPGKLAQNLAKDILVTAYRVFPVDAFPCFRIEFPWGVPDGGFFLSWSVTLPFNGICVQDFRAFDVFQPFESIHDGIHVVAIDRTEIPEPESLEEISSGFGNQAFFRFSNESLKDISGLALAQAVPNAVLYFIICRIGGKSQQVRMQPALVSVDGHLVVVQDDEQVGIAVAGIVQSLQGKASGHGSVANQGDCFFI